MYEKATMKVVEVQHSQMLCASDGVNAVRSSYGITNIDTWGE